LLAQSLPPQGEYCTTHVEGLQELPQLLWGCRLARSGREGGGGERGVCKRKVQS